MSEAEVRVFPSQRRQNAAGMTAAERAADLQAQAKIAAREAVEALFAPLASAEAACNSVVDLQHVPPGIRDRARRLAEQIRADAQAILLQQGRRP